MGIPSIKPKTKWHQRVRSTPPEVTCDKDMVMSWIEALRKQNTLLKKEGSKFEYRLTVSAPSHRLTSESTWDGRVTPGRVKTMLNKNNQLDANIWINLRATSYQHWNKGVPARERWVYNETANSNWCLDLDNVKDVYNNEDLLKLFKSRGALHPAMIVQTSPNSFHCLYNGVAGYWTLDRRHEVARQLAGIGKRPESVEEYSKRLKDGAGVDIGYLNQSSYNQRIRVPGSCNYKPDGSYFICKGWMNDGYNSYDPEKPFDITQQTRDMPILVTDEPVVTKEPPRHSKTVRHAIRDKYFKVLSKMMIKALSKKCSIALPLTEYIINNFMHLKNNELAMPQDVLAKEFGCHQVTLSRVLKKLRDKGYLDRVQDHLYAGAGNSRNKAAVYGMGPGMITALSIRDSKDNGKALVNKIKNDYVDGSKSIHNDFLVDVRAMFLLGFQEEDFLELAKAKLQHVRTQDWMMDSTIRSIWDNFNLKFHKYADENYDKGYRVPSGPIVDVDSLVEQVYHGFN